MALIVSKGKRIKNYSVLLYGTSGIGKTTLANFAESPVVFDCEDGSSEIDCTRVEIDSLETLEEAIEKAKTGKSKTVIIDSLTAIEGWLVARILKENNWKSLAAPAWGAGPIALKEKWREFQDSVKNLNKFVNVIQIAHSKVSSVEDPLATRSYDRFEPDVHNKSITTIASAVDHIFFYRWQVSYKPTDIKGETIAHTKGRELYTVEAPSYLAKNRKGLESPIFEPDHTLFERLV